MGAVSWRLVGWQAVFASRLAPTVGMGQSVGDWSAGRPSSRAGSLLQLDWVSQLEIGRLSGRLRGQARSYNWMGAVSWRLVGCQAVFASRLAPTVEWGQSVGNWSAVRPSSRAGSLLQWNGGSQLETGRLSGRHREQARSYNWIGSVSWRLVGCQAAIASRLAPAEEQKPNACSSPLNGRVSARRKLLILPCRPHRQAEWRGLSGGGSAATFGAAKHIERRCSEANRRRCPRMNPATKEPEPRRGPYAGAKPFGYFSASGKVTRRKGETASRNTRSNR
ncbi:hypothetical protein BW33_01193 [Pseudomonas sp. RIT288]|nr:hypothetical protein BW33_01193 [Pseudomonas sp. RIT288]